MEVSLLKPFKTAQVELEGLLKDQGISNTQIDTKIGLMTRDDTGN